MSGIRAGMPETTCQACLFTWLLHTTSLGFLTPWWSQGNWTSGGWLPRERKLKVLVLLKARPIMGRPHSNHVIRVWASPKPVQISREGKKRFHRFLWGKAHMQRARNNGWWPSLENTAQSVLHLSGALSFSSLSFGFHQVFWNPFLNFQNVQRVKSHSNLGCKGLHYIFIITSFSNDFHNFDAIFIYFTIAVHSTYEEMEPQKKWKHSS